MRNYKLEILEARAYLSTVTFPATPAEYGIGDPGAQGDFSLDIPAVADFNGDGIPDLAFANNSLSGSEGGISVLLGKSGGTFGAQTHLDAGHRPYQVIAGDFNNDGKQDLVVNNTEDSTVYFYAGNGDGTFAAPISSSYSAPITGGDVAYLTAADLNGDGKLDLIVTGAVIVADTPDVDQMVIMLGDGTGHFTTKQTIAGEYDETVTGKFTGSGNLDIAAALPNQSTLDIFKGNGDGTFSTTPIQLVTNAPGGDQGYGLATGDFNGDGIQDLVLLSASETSNNQILSVFLGQSGGGFGSPVDTMISNASSVAVGDFNGDGKLDVLTSDSANLVVYLGNGDGSFQTTPAYDNESIGISGAPAVADLNADGKPDIIAAVAPSDLQEFPTAHAAAIFLNGQTGGGGGGGGGGSGGTTGLTPAIVSTTVPASLVGGAKIHGTLKVTLTDSGSTAERGYTVNVYASSDTTLNTATDTFVTNVTKPTVTVKAGKSTPVIISITGLPASLSDGSYYLIAEAVDSSGNIASVATPAPVVVTAPFVMLTETLTDTLPASLVSGTSAKGKVTVTIINHGNVPSKGITPIEVTASTSTGVLGTQIAMLSKNLTIAPGKTIKVVVPITSTPALADGNYFIVAQTTDPFDADTSVSSSTSSTTVAAPFITLAAVLGPVTKLKAGDTLTLTNNGNIEDDATFTATIGFSTDAAGAMPVGQTQSASKAYHVKAGKNIKIHSAEWAKITSGLTAGVAYYLTVSVSDGKGDTAFAVSPTSFTL